MGGFTITPDCYGELICCVDDLFVVGEGTGKLPTCFLVGLLDGPLRIEAAGVVRCMAARLRPWSIGPISREDPGLPPRGWKDAEGVFGPARPDHGAWSDDATGILSRDFRRIVDRRIGRLGPADGHRRAGQFLGDGPRPTAIVAREQHTSSRQVERRVRRLTGTSPKRLACLSRFQKVRDAIWADPSIDLARLRSMPAIRISRT